MTEGDSAEADVQARMRDALIDGAEFARLRSELAGGDRASRALARRLALWRAVLELAGEQGYEEVTIEALVERSGTNRTEFYGTFEGKEACFAAAYRAAGEALCERLLAHCTEAPDWRSGMRAALRDLGRLVVDEPALCGALVGAGALTGAVAAEREVVVGRLSRAIDRARRESDDSRHPSPPFTSRFILSAIEAGVVRFLAERGEGDLHEVLAAMLYLAVAPYFGPEAARAEVAKLA